MVKAFVRICVIGTAVDKLLLAEGASLASTRTLVGAVANDFGLFAGINARSVDQGVVAVEDGALAIVTSRVFQTE